MAAEPHESPAELDAAFRALSHRYSRTVCRYLHSSSTETATVHELARIVLEREVGETDENRIAIYLHHVTLPKLADEGLIEYDPRSKTVRCRGHSALDPLLRRLVEDGRSSP